MKLLFKITFTIIFLLSITQNVNAQFLKKLKKQVEDKVEKEVDQRTKKRTDKTIDDAFDKVEDSIDGKKKVSNSNAKPVNAKNESNVVNSNAASQASLVWAKYDFVPGDKIIFEDNLIGEENGEFPSRWDLTQGNVEIAQLGGENVIMLRAGSPEIVPYFKEPQKDYLPEVFTVEFDLFCGTGTFQVNLYDRKNQKSGSPSGYTSIKIRHNQMGWTNSFSEISDQSLPKKRWVHIAIAYTNGKLKAYLDETRLINVPRIDFDPKGITLYTYIFGTLHEGHYYVKNVRIAEGGVKYYDRFLQDGKIVTNGIRFDVNKATLKPESMGVINEIVKLMKQHPEIKFSVEGHTDSDGDDASNLTLSDERAKTVKNTMVKLGISEDRLSTKGMGETASIDTNDTPEGKANNRRVEFVKK